ncbi:hypothetical protein [Streptacidiphilus rugosus]|uniref:hypothetical protein n=1 Tax=Streptacidiphilus rugosus TaxID=405783 RepID=UPI00068DBBA1|nr:hypothetical protein [Streptacidiphilus rugosus]
MNTKASAKTPVPELPFALTAEERLRHYTPEEVVELRLLPVGVRWLKRNANAKRIPHTLLGERITFRLEHLYAISLSREIDPALQGRVA